jgi:hypothetical protein
VGHILATNALENLDEGILEIAALSCFSVMKPLGLDLAIDFRKD